MELAIERMIEDMHPLPQPILKEVADCFRVIELPKNYILLRQGRVCRELWFMTAGVVRHFYTNDDGKELNTWFSIDQDIVGAIPSFANQVPSYESIQLLEDSILYAIDYQSVQSLLKKHHAFALWYIRVAEQKYYAQIEDRIGDLQFLDAKQRYQKLLSDHPNITNRISLGHIASFLNITQETLSRIRSGKL